MIYQLLAKFLPRDLKLAIKRHVGVRDVRFTLANLKTAGFEPPTIVDVGAYDADWSAAAARLWPRANFHLFEPNPEHAPACKAFCAGRGTFHPLAVSEFDGVSNFKVEGTNSHLASGSGTITVNVTTLTGTLGADAVAEHSLLKIDVQGEDLRVARGAAALMSRFDVVIIEVSLIPLSPRAPDMRAALDFFEPAGFRLFDFCSFWERPVDRALWQVDAVFVNRESRYGNVALGY